MITVQAAVFLSLLLSMIALPPVEATISVNLEDENNSNPFEDLFCTFIACTSEGDPEAVGFFENLASDLSDFLTGNDGNRRNLLRGKNGSH